MIIKRYIVNDMKEALIRAKYELGREAIIVSQKDFRPGKWYNPFRKKKLEVTVAVEDDFFEKKSIETAGKKVHERVRENSEDTIDKFVPKKNKNLYNCWKDYCGRNGISDDSVGCEHIKNFIDESFKGNPFGKEAKSRRINVIIGPTGVGKTTTIAKIASRELLGNNKKVGLITIDTYRIAAVEQLKKYAEILGINCEIINDPSEMKEKLFKLKDCDVILVDTVGASPKDGGRIEEIKTYVNEIEEEKNVYLTLSMSTDVDTNNSIMDAYKAMEYNSIILTKLDEVKNFINFWNIIEKNKVPIKYFCFGQTVPEDISEASLDNMLSYLRREIAID